MSWICPKCDRELVKENQWHNCVRVSLDDLFKNRPKDLILVLDRVLSSVMDWENVLISTTQNCIVFMHHQTFLVIRPMKTQIDLKFFSPHKCEQVFIFQCLPYSGKFQNHIRLQNEEELNPLIIDLLRKSYDFL